MQKGYCKAIYSEYEWALQKDYNRRVNSKKKFDQNSLP
jgi:hypothetical protein